MFLAKVEGSVVATKKDASLSGRKLLLLRPQLVDDQDPTRFRPGVNTIVAVDSVGAGVGGGLDGGDVADDDGGDEGVADLGHGAGELDVRGLEHRVRALDEGHESARFNESNGLRHSFVFF